MMAEVAASGCRVMGIVNVTPDSFSDGGRFLAPAAAVCRARALAAAGAAIVDIGGESTRPGAAALSWEEEWRRISPVLEGVRGIGPAVSVDTYHPETAARALAAGAKVVNCVFAEAVPAMVDLLDRSPAGVELVVPASCLALCRSRGVADRVYIDPMVGFGTTREEDLALLRSVADLAKEGRVLVGASRKRIVRALAEEANVDSLLGGDVAVALWAVSQGAAVVRVHDVAETVQAIRVWERISGCGARVRPC